MTAHDPVGEGLAAALIQISAHAERISGIDAREAGHYQEIASQLRELAAEVAATSTRVGGIGATLSRQAAIVDGLHGLEAQVTALATQLADISTTAEEDDAGRYQPVPQPRWWRNTGRERDAALDRLRAWVEHIYRPSYGQLAAMLPPCWEHHPLCMFTLDWLSELWSFLYLSPQRDGRALAAQGEWQTRLLPAAAEQMAYEATSCQHSRVPAGGQSPAAARAHRNGAQAGA